MGRRVAAKAEVSRSEIEFFIVEGIIRDVHFSILAQQLPFVINHHRRVVVDAGRAFLKERGHDDHLQLGCQLAQDLCGGSGNRFSKVEENNVFLLAEVVRAKQLLQADNLSTLGGCLTDLSHSLLKILTWIAGAAHLNQAQPDQTTVGFLRFPVLMLWVLVSTAHLETDYNTIEDRHPDCRLGSARLFSGIDFTPQSSAVVGCEGGLSRLVSMA